MALDIILALNILVMGLSTLIFERRSVSTCLSALQSLHCHPVWHYPSFLTVRPRTPLLELMMLKAFFSITYLDRTCSQPGQHTHYLSVLFASTTLESFYFHVYITHQSSPAKLGLPYTLYNFKNFTHLFILPSQVALAMRSLSFLASLRSIRYLVIGFILLLHLL